MRKITVSACLLVLVALGCNAQTEFHESKASLIYADTTIKLLKHIVDSLNLKFKTCDFSKTYQSKSQTRAHYVQLEGEQVKAAQKDMQAQISYDDFVKKYPEAVKENDLLVVTFTYKNYSNKQVLDFSSLEIGGKYEHRITFDKNLASYKKPFKGKWVYNYFAGYDDVKDQLSAFFFVEEFREIPIPLDYAKMIQYSDCMVDTTAQIFNKNAKRTSFRYNKNDHVKTEAFFEYIRQHTDRPRIDTSNYEEFYRKCEAWESVRLKKIDSLKAHDQQFNTMFNAAVKEVIRNGGADNEFEEYFARYYSSKMALEFKRNRIVVGTCSMDSSPRIHAFNIAKLSAETVNWEIFLRSHLDIMNDNFERNSDGSYAWGGRKTYIKELEVLDINVLDLLLGISLRIENPNSNHYYGSISRLGRALAETQQAATIENKMLQMIADERLDDYNRMLIYYLFLNYNYSLESKEKQATNKVKLAQAVEKLPVYLSSKMPKGIGDE